MFYGLVLSMALFVEEMNEKCLPFKRDMGSHVSCTDSFRLNAWYFFNRTHARLIECEKYDAATVVAAAIDYAAIYDVAEM